MKICVTAEDIKKGRRGSPKRCPIALATKRACGVRAVVGTDGTMWVETSSACVEISLSLAAMNFVDDFDLGLAVGPFEFDVNFEPDDESA
jgi:hypothetical protein